MWRCVCVGNLFILSLNALVLYFSILALLQHAVTLYLQSIQSPVGYAFDLAYSFYPNHAVITVHHYLFHIYFIYIQLAATDVNPEFVAVCVWTFQTNGHRQQSRDNPSRLCKYQSACLELNVNALIWNANCILWDMSKQWRVAFWDGQLKVSLLHMLNPRRPFNYYNSRQILAFYVFGLIISGTHTLLFLTKYSTWATVWC